jgi:hypothetical protein
MKPGLNIMPPEATPNYQLSPLQCGDRADLQRQSNTKST